MKNTPCENCNNTEGDERCPEHQNVPVVKARICPIEDGTCPTTILKINKASNDPRHCGYDAHIIRAIHTEPIELQAMGSHIEE
jgi:hypothetical protein